MCDIGKMTKQRNQEGYDQTRHGKKDQLDKDILSLFKKKGDEYIVAVKSNNARIIFHFSLRSNQDHHWIKIVECGQPTNNSSVERQMGLTTSHLYIHLDRVHLLVKIKVAEVLTVEKWSFELRNVPSNFILKQTKIP